RAANEGRRRSLTRMSRVGWPSARATSRSAAGLPSARPARHGSWPNAIGARSRLMTAACSSGSPRGGRSGTRAPGSGGALLGPGQRWNEACDVIIRPRRDRARAGTQAVTDEPRDEPRVTTPTAPDEDPPDRRRAQHAWPKKSATQKRNAVQLVDPMQRYAETDRSDQDEPAHELGVADGEVHR